MTLEEALKIVNECMKKLEDIPVYSDEGVVFYPPADEHLERAYQELDEAAGQLGSAVKWQQEQGFDKGS